VVEGVGPELQRNRNYGSLGEFETYPDRVPAMDSCQQFVRITLRTMPVHGFDHSPVCAARLETYPDWGVNYQFPKLILSD
jgi:hypothetical protein